MKANFNIYRQLIILICPHMMLSACVSGNKNKKTANANDQLHLQDQWSIQQYQDYDDRRLEINKTSRMAEPFREA